MQYRKPVIIEKLTCGKIDRCKHAVCCPYCWQMPFSGLCFERKSNPNYARKKKGVAENGRRQNY